MAQLKNLTNLKVDYVTVIKQAPSRNKHVYWLCQCECGNYCEFSAESLLRVNRKRLLHCGCKTQKKTDLTGEVFGRLQVKEKTNERKNGCVVWLCQCECGNLIKVPTNYLSSKHTRSCGCLAKDAHRIDLTNQTFGKLRALQVDPNNSDNWICECKCGTVCSVNGYNLRANKTKSCGCINYSIGEQNILDILKNNNIPYIKEYTCSELNRKRFDFALLEQNKIIRLIEFDGEQHYKERRGNWDKNDSLLERQKRDKEKNQYALFHNIPLVRIPYWERDKITLEMIMGDQYLVKGETTLC